MLDEKANTKLRLLAMDAASGEGIDEAIEPLKTMAQGKDVELRMHAFSALSVMIHAWPSVLICLPTRWKTPVLKCAAWP